MTTLSIIGTGLTLLMPIIGWFLDRAKVSEATKQAFFEFCKKAAKDIGSVKLMEYGDFQLKWLKEHPWKEGVST